MIQIYKPLEGDWSNLIPFLLACFLCVCVLFHQLRTVVLICAYNFLIAFQSEILEATIMQGVEQPQNVAIKEKVHSSTELLQCAMDMHSSTLISSWICFKTTCEVVSHILSCPVASQNQLPDDTP